MNLKIGNRGQEEMVGFVMIMVIVAVGLLVFLAFSFNKGGIEVKESAEIRQFLDSAMEYTSECAISYEPAYSKIRGLIAECFDKKTCINEKSACEVLNSSMSGLLEGAWLVGEERVVKAYEFNSTYETNSSGVIRFEEVMFIARGNCTGNIRGSSTTISRGGGSIVNSLKLCY